MPLKLTGDHYAIAALRARTMSITCSLALSVSWTIAIAAMRASTRLLALVAPETIARRSRPGPFGGPLNLAMVAANALGIGFFLWAASHAWASRLARAPGTPPEPGDAFVWFVESAPVLAAVLLLNVSWVLITIVRQQWRNAIPFVAVVGLWCVALVIDNLQH